MFRWALSALYGIVVLQKQSKGNRPKESKKMENKIKITATQGNWKIGTINGIKFNAKVYEEPSEEYGLNKSNVSKLWIDGVCNYDRGWDVRAKTAEGKAMIKAILTYFKNPETSNK